MSTIQIRPELGVFWRTRSSVQIGWDPRVGVVIEGLSAQEQDLLTHLVRPMTHTELEVRATRSGIEPTRLVDLVTTLRRAEVLCREHPASGYCVEVASLDHVGTAISLALSRCGVTVTSCDRRVVNEADHPGLVIHGLNRERRSALLTARRSENCSAIDTGVASLFVVTGSRLIHPARTTALAAEGIPHLLAWVEDVDVCVGPLVVPGRTSCAGCRYSTSLDHDPAWAILASQAVHAPAITPAPHARDLAASLAARAIVTFAETGENPLANTYWRIGPAHTSPRLVEAPPHPDCGCTTATTAICA